MIYTLTLNPAMDHVVRLPRLAEGETNRAIEESTAAGGKGINVSKLLKNLGERSIAWGFLAGFTGREIERILRYEDGILSDFIYLSEGFTRINTKIKADRETEINGPGPNIRKGELQQLFDKLAEIKKGDYLFLSGSIPASLGESFYAEIMEKLEGREVQIAVDTTGEPLRRTLPYHPILVKPNLRELEDFFKTSIQTQEEIKNYAGKLQELGALNVIISMGGDGAYFLSKEGESLFLDAPEGTVIDTVGSGDSLVAGFIYGVKNGMDATDSFRWGVSCGSATAFSETLATRKEVEAIYEQMCGGKTK
ncbi:MAG: 1-phosphofructokinase [Peptoniphilaceae bacterium]|nr:1-phosphofructokinase [Peptoniphilaceae bacterium]